MALSSVTVTFDIADLAGVDFDPRRTKVFATTNVPGGVVIDTVGNQIRLGSGNATVGADGTGSISVWAPGAGSNPASWQTTIHVDYPDRNADRGRRVQAFGPFTITTSANLADLVAEMPVQPEYAMQFLNRYKTNDHGNVSGTLSLDPAYGYHVFDATSATLVTVLPGDDIAFKAISGADNVTVDGATDLELSDGGWVTGVYHRGAWDFTAGGTGTPATPGETTPPTAGTLAGSAITSTGFTLTVTGAADETALHSSPYSFSTDNGTTWTAYQSSAVKVVTGLTSETAYQCKHRVKDAAGNVTVGTMVTVTTGVGPISITENFTATDGTNLIGKTTTTGGKTWIPDADSAGVSASQSTAAINSNRLSGGTAAAAINVATPTAKVTADYNTSGGDRAALFVAGTGTSNTIAVQILGDATAKMWTNVNLSEVATGACPISGTAELSYDGTTAILKVGGSTILSYAVSGKTGTKAGVGILGTAWIDNVTIAAL